MIRFIGSVLIWIFGLFLAVVIIWNLSFIRPRLAISRRAASDFTGRNLFPRIVKSIVESGGNDDGESESIIPEISKSFPVNHDGSLDGVAVIGWHRVSHGLDADFLAYPNNDPFESENHPTGIFDVERKCQQRVWRGSCNEWRTGAYFEIVKIEPLTQFHFLQPDALFGSFSRQFGGFRSFFGSLSLFFYDQESPQSSVDSAHANEDQEHRWQVCGTKKAAEVAIRFAGGCYCLLFGCSLVYREGGGKLRRISGPALIGLGLAAFLFPPYYEGDCENNENRPPPLLKPSLHGITVTQKLLTTPYYCNTLIAIGRQHMANVLSTEKQGAIVGLLAEGSSIRSIERITGVHRDTIMRLGVRVGKGCARLLDAKMRDLSCKQLQFDELWGFIGKKERHCKPDDSLELGDVWTFCAIDAETKLVPSFKVGKRDLATANAFVSDVASRVRNRVQISSDALAAYVQAIETNFGADVDFAQIVKTYVTDDSHVPERRFSAPEIVITEKKAIAGFPDLRKASTSHIERLNGTTRLHMRRLTRLTYAFSKKLENFEAAVALHFAYYNFVKRHITLRATPAMAAGIERDFWTVGDLVEAA